MSTRISRGTYYVTALRERTSKFNDVRTYGDQVGRQIRTRKEAFAILDRLNERGYVQQWSDSQQQRFIVGERDAQGVWSAINPFTGAREVFEVQP